MGHYAIDKMSLRAKETVYWPGITEDIRLNNHHCQICAKFARTQQRETLQPIETPQAAWEQLGLDIFSLRKHTISSSSWLFQSVPSCKTAAESPFIEHNQASQRHLHRDRYSKMHCLRWWHPIHFTRVQRFHKSMGNTSPNHITHKCTA